MEPRPFRQAGRTPGRLREGENLVEDLQAGDLVAVLVQVGRERRDDTAGPVEIDDTVSRQQDVQVVILDDDVVLANAAPGSLYAARDSRPVAVRPQSAPRWPRP
jgi:hypothetical protein